MAQWRRLKAASAARSASISRFFASLWCSIFSSRFSLLGECVKVSICYRFNDAISSHIHFSFITFPQILYDGFQADNVSSSIANQSLPEANFEFFDLLTADVSEKLSLISLAFFSILKFVLQIAPQFHIHNLMRNNRPKNDLTKDFFLKLRTNQKSYFLSFIACAPLIARIQCGSGKTRILLLEMKTKNSCLSANR